MMIDRTVMCPRQVFLAPFRRLDKDLDMGGVSRPGSPSTPSRRIRTFLRGSEGF